MIIRHDYLYNTSQKVKYDFQTANSMYEIGLCKELMARLKFYYGRRSVRGLTKSELDEFYTIKYKNKLFFKDLIISLSRSKWLTTRWANKWDFSITEPQGVWKQYPKEYKKLYKILSEALSRI